MKQNIKFFISALLLCPAFFGTAGAATCSKANLTRCLDSACAINISSNRAARCQLCGTASAGAAVTNTGMKSLSVGQSANTTLSDKDLKSAPSDPGARYAWATGECLKKITGCGQDDVTDTYDPLIEQSCKAAGINAQMAALQSAARKTKTQNACETEFSSCLIGAKRCTADFSACVQQTDFDKFFAACAVEISGCDEFVSVTRTNLMTDRDNAEKNQQTLLTNIVSAYQNARATQLKEAHDACTDNKAREDCIKDVCAQNMKNKCAAGYQSEKSMATLLCKFHDTACDRLK